MRESIAWNGKRRKMCPSPQRKKQGLNPGLSGRSERPARDWACLQRRLKPSEQPCVTVNQAALHPGQTGARRYAQSDCLGPGWWLWECTEKHAKTTHKWQHTCRNVTATSVVLFLRYTVILPKTQVPLTWHSTLLTLTFVCLFSKSKNFSTKLRGLRGNWSWNLKNHRHRRRHHHQHHHIRSSVP